MKTLFDDYQLMSGYDEMFEAKEKPRPHYRQLCHRLQELTVRDFDFKRRQGDQAFMRQGITFTVYGDPQQNEKIFPFDLIPRIIPNSEWSLIERGIRQRVTALNHFLLDIYTGQKILRDRIVPRRLVESSIHFRKDFCNFRPPKDIYIHIAGIDLIRDHEGTYYVLEDNLRSPSGISYVLGESYCHEAAISEFIFGNASASG